MHNTTAPRKQGRGFTIKIEPVKRGNLFSINAQIQQAAMADKRRARRKMKQDRKARNWKEEG